MLATFGLAIFMAFPSDNTSAEDTAHPDALSKATSTTDPSAQFAINVVMNSGFELIADSTTTPPKYGSYWRDAFTPERGDPTDRIVEYAPGNRGLLLTDKSKPASQILTLYGPYAESFELVLRVRFTDLDDFVPPDATGSEETARLVIGVMTQFGREVSALRYRVGGTEADDDESEQPIGIPLTGAPDADGFHRVRIPIGRDVTTFTGGPPEPWNKLLLSANAGSVLIDDVIGVHQLPRIAPRELREYLLQDVRDHLATYLGRPGRGIQGLGLVDPRTGYQTIESYDVRTGKIGTPNPMGMVRGIHDLMLRYLRIDEPTTTDGTVDGPIDQQKVNLRQLVRNRLFSFLGSMLRWNIYEPTGLYCQYNARTHEANTVAAMAPHSYIEFVLDATQLAGYVEFEGKRDRAIERAVQMADALVRLHREHDLPAHLPFTRGPRGNWFGRLPNMLHPDGTITEPLAKPGKYDQAWAIKGDRSWYHDFDSAAALAAVWAVAPKDAYLTSIRRTLEKFDRQWDADRYDMENDTDDHYGMNVEALLMGFKASQYQLTELRDKAQEFTDYRLPRVTMTKTGTLREDGEPEMALAPAAWDDNLWVQGIRLGSFTTGDQPRAYRGPIWLHNIPSDHNEATSGWRNYRHALREFAKGDLRRRLMDDGYMTDASSWQWEQISACFKGDYIDACSKGKDWEGDMGDLFAGPAANAFRCLGRTLEITRRGPNREFIAWYYLSAAHVQKMYREKYGYRFGMSKETARRYNLRENDAIAWTTSEPYSFATLISHAETLDSVDLDYDPAFVKITSVTRVAGSDSIDVTLRGSPGRDISLFAAAETVFSDADVTDWRLRYVDPNGAETRTAQTTLDSAGHATVRISGLPARTVSLDAVLRTEDGEDVDDMASAEYLL